MTNRKGGVGFVVFVLLLLLVIAVVFVIIYIKGNEEPVVPEGLNVSVNVSLFNVSVSSDALGRVDYVLRNESWVFVDGFLFPSALEFYRGGVPNGSLVWLSAWSGEYYWNESVCNVSFDDFPCRVGLKRKALGYQISFNGSELVVDANESGGVLQAPVLLCWTEKASTINVVMDLPSASVPADLKKNVDFCYKVEQDIVGRRVFFVDVHKNPFLNVSDLLFVTVRDFEKKSFSNIGDKNAGVLI